MGGWKMNWKHAKMCADVSNSVYKDDKECYADIASHIMTKASYKFLDEKGAQGCMFKHTANEWVIAFRGTQPEELGDVLADLKAWRNTSETIGVVHAGFKNEIDKLYDDVLLYCKSKKIKKTDKIIVTGHSLGAAMATLCASRLSHAGYDIVLYNFGSPRVGNKDWAEQFDNIPAHRFVNNNDIVTKVPPYGLFTHIGELHYINYYGNIRKSTWWQRFKDQMRGRWRALQKFQFFDGAFDHSMGLYADKVNKHNEEV